MDNIYNNLVKLSRNKIFYKNFSLNDCFSTRLKLIFIHLAFLLINLKKKDKKISQELFDHTFVQIERNLREIGFGDTSINKEMKKNINYFYHILLECEKFSLLSLKNKKIFFIKYFDELDGKNDHLIALFVNYFDKFHIFSLQLSLNSIIKGNINFIYK